MDWLAVDICTTATSEIRNHTHIMHKNTDFREHYRNEEMKTRARLEVGGEKKTYESCVGAFEGQDDTYLTCCPTI